MLKPIIVILWGLAAWIIQMIYFIKDDRTPNSEAANKGLNLRWHIAGGAIHIWGYYLVALHFGAHWGLLMASLTWLLFDGFVNSYILNKEFFYVGNTALLDQAQQWLASLAHKDARLISAILKIVLLITSLIILIHRYGGF